MDTMARALPLDEFRLGHGLLKCDAVARVDEVVCVAGKDDDFGHAPRDVPQPRGRDVVREPRCHL